MLSTALELSSVRRASSGPSIAFALTVRHSLVGLSRTSTRPVRDVTSMTGSAATGCGGGTGAVAVVVASAVAGARSSGHNQLRTQ
jgi:hypothetical protein